MFICTLKFVTSTTVDDTVKVKVAATDCPGWSLAPPWFHVKVIGPSAPAGVQLLVAMLNVSASPLLVFLIYIVCVMFPPAVKVPQFMELNDVVQALFEYTPKFAEVVT
jgi:hypothetical protein